jgi:hypothetical protein
MVSYVEIIAVLGILAAVGGWFLLKEKKTRKKVAVVGAFLAFVGAAFGGLAFAGVPAFLSSSPTGGNGGGPTAGSLWQVVYGADADSDTDRTETELFSTDRHSVLYILSDTNMDGLGDVTLGFIALNLNQGKTTDAWQLEVGIVSVGTVIVTGVPTPIANYTTDRSRFAVTITRDSGTGTMTQVHDRAYAYDITSGASQTFSVDMLMDPAVLDDLPAGGNVLLVYSAGGIVLTCTLQES